MAYGYEDDNVSAKSSSLVFGLNAGAARLVKLEWINNGGAAGAEQEALDIQFAIEGQERLLSYRQFPIKKAFDDKGGEITDSKDPIFIEAQKTINQCITHIMHCFIGTEILKIAFQQPVESFKEYCKILSSLLPKDYDKIRLDIFMQYQWQIKNEAKQTYLELPKKMNQGKWICREVVPVGKWKEVRATDCDDKMPMALKYVDDANNIHPFIKGGYFVNHPWANQQKDESVTSIQDLRTIEVFVEEIMPTEINSGTESETAKGW